MTPAHSGEEMLGGSQPQGKPRMDGKGHGNMAWSRDLLQELSGCDCNHIPRDRILENIMAHSSR